MDDCEYEGYLFEQGWFEYTPIRTCYPRRGHIGERVYFEVPLSHDRDRTT